MAVKIRLQPTSKNSKHNVYNIIVVDSRKTRDGRYLEHLGTYSTENHTKHIVLDIDRMLHWISKGAQLTNTLKQDLYRSNILKNYKV